MPILIPPDPSSPLSQGDVLSGITLFATGDDWGDKGGTPEQLKSRLSLVISRPCVPQHKSQIVVASIEGRFESIPSTVENFKQAEHFLKTLRDGVGRPDSFYLGQIPGQKQGRYYAKLDSIHTIALPDDHSGFMQSHRIASLHQDFVRDLHVRIFGAFSSLGFDDYAWLSDHDLEWMIRKGTTDLRKLEADLSATEEKRSEVAASGVAKKKDSVESIDKEVESRRKLVEEARESLRPYEEEQRRRGVSN